MEEEGNHLVTTQLYCPANTTQNDLSAELSAEQRKELIAYLGSKFLYYKIGL